MPLITDWIMVGITAIYVIATIFICVFNYKTAKATNEQTNELKKQFYAVNRPIVTVEMAFLKRKFLAVRFVNRGAYTAYDVNVKFDDEFIESIENDIFKTKLYDDKDAVFTLGVSQSHDIFIGEKEYINTSAKQNVKGHIIYKGIDGSIYYEDFEIRLENYATIYSVKSDLEEITDQLQTLNKNMCHLIDAEKEKNKNN